MADLFPIGLMANGSSNGTIDSKSYEFFEPNFGCKSFPSYNVLVSTFEQKSISTRKKNEPYLVITHSYNNILTREYRVIERFIDSIAEDGLNSFYIVAFDKGETPSSISLSGSNWVTSISDTQYYSSITNNKANAAFLTDGIRWRAGAILAVVANTSVTVDLTIAPFGNLALANAQTNGNIYPIYQCYLSPNQLQSWEKTHYVDAKINSTEDGGWTYSGDLTFVSKYKV